MRIDLVAAFAGPALYGELTLVDKSSFDELKSTSTLRRSLDLAGWTNEVLESLEQYWLPDADWSCLNLWGVRLKDYFINVDIFGVLDAEVLDLLRMQAKGPVFLGIGIHTRFCRTSGRKCLVWNLIFSANPISYDKKYQHKNVPNIYKILISDPRQRSDDLRTDERHLYK
jgi:hypothetical protein